MEETYVGVLWISGRIWILSLLCDLSENWGLRSPFFAAIAGIDVLGLLAVLLKVPLVSELKIFAFILEAELKSNPSVEVRVHPNRGGIRARYGSWR